MEKLNFPDYDFRLRQRGSSLSIFDPFRRRYVALTPEEWVRQHLARYLAGEKKVPAGLISLEARVRVVNAWKRYDLVVFTPLGSPLLVAEVKAPTVRISQEVLDQVLRYNAGLKAPFIMISNGLKHYCLQYRQDSRQFGLTDDIPGYAEMVICGESI